MAARESGCACMLLHVSVVVRSLGKGLQAPGDIAHKGSLSCVDPEMICEVGSLLKKSCIRINAR